MRPRPRLRWLYRSGALPAVEYGEFSDSGNKAPAADLHLVTTPAASAVHSTRVGLAAVPISPGPATWACRRKEAGMPRTRRIVAGVSNSPGNLPALRHAADLARVYDAALTFVHAWLPSGPEFAAWPFPSDPLVLQWQDDAWQRMWHALDTAFGGLPPDLEAEPLVMRGNPGPVLVGAASRDGDRLVVGAGRRGTFGRLRHGRVSRYCLAHAGCPVIAVPSPALNRADVRAARAMRAFRT